MLSDVTILRYISLGFICILHSHVLYVGTIFTWYFSTKLLYAAFTPLCLVPPGKVKVNVKVQFTLEQATKAQRGSRDIALLFH
jgi:predicted secreted Zn-dependent protease